ncbi:MAG: DUF2089 family protein [Gammaproteobacteria bacterium]
MSCRRCGLDFGGTFGVSPLARLAGEDAQLALLMIMSGGNLKQLAGELGITYPTLRKRVDRLISRVKSLREEEEAEIERLLQRIESGEIGAEEGVRLIQEMKGET